MSLLLNGFTVLCVVLGGVFFLAGTVGLLRFPDPASRLHALTKPDNLGLGLIVLGLLPRATDPADALKLILIWMLVQFGAGTAAQLLAHRGRTDESAR